MLTAEVRKTLQSEPAKCSKLATHIAQGSGCDKIRYPFQAGNGSNTCRLAKLAVNGRHAGIRSVPHVSTEEARIIGAAILAQKAGLKPTLLTSFMHAQAQIRSGEDQNALPETLNGEQISSLQESASAMFRPTMVGVSYLQVKWLQGHEGTI